MKAEKQMVYKCDYCRAYYLRGHAAIKHEKYCAKNPANQHACYDCIFLDVGRVAADNGYSEKTFTCTKLDKQLHSAKAEKIDHSCLGYTERMPLECPERKTEVDKYFAMQRGIEL